MPLKFWRVNARRNFTSVYEFTPSECEFYVTPSPIDYVNLKNYYPSNDAEFGCDVGIDPVLH